MSAPTFDEVLAAIVKGSRIGRCVEALRADDQIADLLELPTLRKLYADSRESELAGTQGALVVGVLGAGTPERVYQWCALVAPGFVARAAAGTHEAKRRAVSLQADCYLALAEFVTTWNRSQIKRVA